MSQIRKSLSIVYHSPYGHTAKVAAYIAQGAKKMGIEVHLMPIEHIDWDLLDASQGIIFGSPTYMGSVSADFKRFMDSSSKRWRDRIWQGKIAAGFANSGGLSGDKLSVLQQIHLFAMQHGMLWSGLPLMSTGHNQDDLNRLASSLGLMTQSDNAPVDITPPQGDLDTAIWFGEYIGGLLYRLH
ncbi:flavodoxin family protein [uncultured Acinetobacter sp.]|uniref:flavodoxin family protein n=1 Tax=uncultured Acinetobacter sp. TaxID=165433 RepID=UPI002584C40C|nr:flavodoxin family protein [uncultured Acinetobacter sp.]